MSPTLGEARWPALGERTRRAIPGLWFGVLLALAFIAAPSLFAALERASAGSVAARLFAVEAQLSLVLSVLLGVLERLRAVQRAADGAGSLFSVELLLVMGALFCTVLGHFALQPMLEATRAGQGAWSFGALHGASAALYGIKALLVATLTWRATGA